MVKRRHRGIVPNSTAGIRVPRGAELRFYAGSYEDSSESPVLTLRAVLGNGLALTHFHWLERQSEWRLWHTSDVFLSKDPNARALAQLPKGTFTAFPAEELEHWLSHERFGYNMNLFEASLAAADLKALMDQYVQRLHAVETSPSRLAAYRRRYELKKALRQPHKLMCTP